MNGAILMDTAIGVLLVFLTFSIVASAVREAISNILDERAKGLRKELGQLITGKDVQLGKSGIEDALNRLLGSNERGKRADAIDLNKLTTVIKSLPPNFQQPLLAGRAAIADVIKDVETQFDSTMAAMSSAYKRRSNFYTAGIGFLLAAGMNFNVIDYTSDLLESDTLRASVAEAAKAFEDDPKKREALADAIVEAAKAGGAKDLQKAAVIAANTIAGVPMSPGREIGWRCQEIETLGECVGRGFSLTAFLSWLIIAFACVPGAKFWHDFIKSLMAARKLI